MVTVTIGRFLGKGWWDMGERGFDLGARLEEVAERWSLLTPLMVQMGIIEDLLHRKLVVEIRHGESFTLHISPEGMSLERGKDPWAHGFMSTTLEQWQKILKGEKPFCAVFRMEPEPERDPVRLDQLAVVERFSTVLQAMVNLPQGEDGAGGGEGR